MKGLQSHDSSAAGDHSEGSRRRLVTIRRPPLKYSRQVTAVCAGLLWQLALGHIRWDRLVSSGCNVLEGALDAKVRNTKLHGVAGEQVEPVAQGWAQKHKSQANAEK